MSTLNSCYWLEVDGFLDTTGKNTGKINEGKMPTVFHYTNSPLGTTIATLSKMKNFPKKTFCKKPTKMHATQQFGLFVTYRAGFIMNTETKIQMKLNTHH